MAQLHSGLLANHRPYADVYADAAARLAATGFVRALGGGIVPFAVDDLYKKVLQLDNATEWILTAITPTWVQVSGAGALASDSVTNTLLANMAQATIKGRAAGAGTGDPTDLSAAQVKTILALVPGDVTGFDTQVRTSQLDQMAPPTADVSLNSHKLTNVADPGSAQDAATKAYVDAQVVGAASIAPLVIPDADTVEQKNSTNTQTFRVYKSDNGAGTYSRVVIQNSGGRWNIETESNGGGSGDDIAFKKGTTAIVYNGGTLAPSTTNTIDLGTSGNIWHETHSTEFWTSAAGRVVWNGRTQISAPASGILQFKDGTGNDGSGTFRFDPRTPSTITSDQNNYSVPVTGFFIRLSTDASRSLTGLTFGGGGVGSGQPHLLVNVGTNPLVLKHDDAGSTAANRFYCSTGADITLSSTATAKEAAYVIYDGTLQRWLVYKK